MKGQFLLDYRFVQVVVDRLRRNNTSVSHFRTRLGVTESEMVSVVNGSVPFTSLITFHQLDHYFNTRSGYWKEVYENTHKVALAELDNDGEEEETSPTVSAEWNQDTVVVPVDLLQCLYDIACEHDYPIAADACEILTKHRKGIA